jgi:hypothetical protein
MKGIKPNFTESDIAELRERCGEYAEDWITAVQQRNDLWRQCNKLRDELAERYDETSAD